MRTGLLLLGFSVVVSHALPLGPQTRPTDASAAPTLTFRPVSLNDSPNMIGGEALRLLIPANWQFDGEIVWRNNPAYPAAVKARTFNPKGVEEIGVMPNLLFYWNPYVTLYFPIGGTYLGNEVRRPVLEPIAALRTFVLPRYWPNLRDARVVAQQDLPELAALGPLKYPDLKQTGRFRAGKLRLEYFERGVPVEQDVYCLTVAFDSQVNGTISTFWGIDEIRYSKAPKGKLDEQYKLMETIGCSTKLNLRWFARYQQLTQILMQNEMNASNRAVELSRYLARTNDHITSTIRQAYENHEAAMDRINERFDTYIRGVEDYRNPSSDSVVQLPSGYTEAWTNSNGEYLLSNDVNFNPNLKSNQGWQRLPKQR
ncbi:MAG: hypothetical protein JOZ62_18625 [Acidobacteriaceae bacterium]|nr:hypothetical protein [Acidobacteriaceae bacterium]